jgi:hypothetical protein
MIMTEEMRVTNLTVDLLQGQATVSLMKQPRIAPQGRPNFTNINVNVPVSTQPGGTENELRRIAIEQAKQALAEAIRTLEAAPL